MIFLDSWIWMKFFSQEKGWKKAEEVLKELEQTTGIISTAVLMEVRYRIRRRFGWEKADRITNIMESFERLDVIPLASEVASFAADLRDKYHGKNGRQFSFGDAIHLATAVMTGCEKLYSGDSDFAKVDEIETVII
jgi:predicted nucleic acid-binding protein